MISVEELQALAAMVEQPPPNQQYDAYRETIFTSVIQHLEERLIAAAKQGKFEEYVFAWNRYGFEALWMVADRLEISLHGWGFDILRKPDQDMILLYVDWSKSKSAQPDN